MARIAPTAFQFQPFSRKQTQILTWWLPESGVSDAAGLIADGAIRAGKTVPMSLSYVMWAMTDFQGQNFGMAGKSIGAFRRNVLGPLKQMLRGRGYHLEDRRADNMVEISRGPKVNYFYIFGGRDERSQDLIQGITLAGMLFDEVALMPQSFVEQAEGRCSVSGAKIWYNCNPAGPSHWFKTDRIDKAEEQDLLHLHFLMDDNLSLDQETKDRYKKRFSASPVFFRRFILGEWCAAEGLIYPRFAEALEPRWRHKQDDEGRTLAAEDYALSIDYGTLNAFAGVLWAREGRTWHALEEYRYSGRDTGQPKTDDDYLQDITAFVLKYIPKAAWPSLDWDGGLLTIVDPSAASFIAALRKQAPVEIDGLPDPNTGKPCTRRVHLFHVRPADNDVLDGIRDTAVCLQSGRIRISDKMTETKKEADGYVWEDNEEADKPTKVNDHLMDAIRYFVRTMKLVKPEDDYNSIFGGLYG